MGEQQPTQAFHIKNADGTAPVVTHVVRIEKLQVLITQPDGCWFAQGLEIDYGAEGNDLDDVRRAFEYGLAATIAAHIREFHSIEHLLRPAPPQVWEAIRSATIRYRYSQVSTHLFPFHIEFLEAA